LFDDINTRSRQLEVASLVGHSRSLGRGLSYLRGRQLDEYSYSVNKESLLNSTSYFFFYRDYQAIGLPLKIGALPPRTGGATAPAWLCRPTSTPKSLSAAR